jgi:hypothetical protein
MRNRIPEVAEATVIEDFYMRSNDSAFVRAILQKVLTTSKQLFREADLYITTDERAQDLIGGTKPAPAAPRHDTNQQPYKRWEMRPRKEVHAAGESRVRKVLVDGGSSINVTFPRTLQGLGVALKELHESDTPFFDIVPTEGEYPLEHIYMPVTFGTPENYRTKFLRFEVANFDCGYNAIIGRRGLAKFMAIAHYTYMILKMPGPQGIITMHADFQGAAECFRVAIQAALTTKPSTASSVQADSKPEEDLAVSANEDQAVTSMRPTEETKRINLGFADERKTAIISSSLDDK